jgi:hypothetical protein
MADLKISALTASTTPLAGTEVLPIVQSSTTKQVSVANLTAGRAVGATSIQFGSGSVLSSYETGTWTPVLQFGANTQTITVNQATYVKVGKSVTINMQVTWAAKSGSGRVYITGLPFAKETGGTIALLAGCPAGSVVTVSAIFYNIDGGGTVLNFAEQAGDINSISLGASGALFCSGTYFV